MQTPRSPPIASTGGRRCTLRSSPTASSTSWSERLAVDLALFDSTRLVGPCATGHPDRMKAAAAEYVRAGASHHPNYPNRHWPPHSTGIKVLTSFPNCTPRSSRNRT